MWRDGGMVVGDGEGVRVSRMVRVVGLLCVLRMMGTLLKLLRVL